MKSTKPTLLRSAYAPSVLAFATFGLLSPTLGRAQAVDQPKPGPVTTAAKPTSVTPTTTVVEKDIVELSPFTVKSEKDTGYFAENTLAGSRINTNLWISPRQSRS